MEQWLIEAEENAKILAKMLYEQIIDIADNICVDKDWYFETVIRYMECRKRGNK